MGSRLQRPVRHLPSGVAGKNYLSRSKVRIEMPRVLIPDNLSAAGVESVKRSGLEVDYRPGLKGAELIEALKGADGVIIRSGVTLTADILKGQPRLKAIVRAGVGVDNIDTQAATREGIVVMNTPAGNTISTAEMFSTTIRPSAVPFTMASMALSYFSAEP